MILNFILHCLSNFFSIPVMYRFFGCFLKKSEKSDKLCIFISIIFGIGLSYIHIYQKNTTQNLIGTLIQLFCISFLFKEGKLKKLIVAGTYLGFSVLLELILYISFVKILSVDMTEYTYKYYIIMVFNDMLRLLMVEFFYHRSKEHETLDKKSSWIMVRVTFLNVAMLLCIGFDAMSTLEPGYYLLIIIGFMLLFENLQIYILFEKHSKLCYENMDKEIYIQDLKHQEQYYALLEEQQQQLAVARHDSKNRLLVLLSLAENNQAEELQKMLREMVEADEGHNEKIYCKNKVLNGILYHKLKALQQDIECKVEILISDETLIHPLDYGIIMGNLLDNAIEGCRMNKYKKKYIYVQISEQKNYIFINIKNSIESCKDPFFYKKTSKKEAWKHGIGLKSVKRTVEKYQGNVDIEIEEGEFSVWAYMQKQIEQ